MLNNSLFTGKLVHLVSLNPQSSPQLWAKWRTNSEFSRLLDMDPAALFSEKSIREWMEKHQDDWLMYEFEIRTIADDRPIGSIGLDNRFNVHGDTFLGIGVGDPDYWGKGYGTEALQLMLQFAFMELNLHRVSLNVFEYNQRAIHSYEKAGFTIEGRQREMLLREGKRWDLVFMGILREEWLAKYPPKPAAAVERKFPLPAGFSARAGRLSDYVQACELINILGNHLNGCNDLNDPEIIRLDWESAGFQPETDIHTVFGPDGRLLGFVECWLNNKPPVHPWNWVCVHPDYLNRGVWEYLLQWAENRSRAALALVPEHLRVSLHTGTEHTNQPGLKSIQKLGWKPLRSYYRMQADFSEAPQVPAAPEGLLIRKYNPETEQEAVYRTFVDSFKDHFGFVEQPFEHGFAAFKHSLIDVPAYDPDYWYVAVDGAEIAGICLCRPVDTEDAQSGWVNVLGVKRAWRKKGLGLFLLKHAFAAFHARGQKRAALGVDASSLTGALHLYEQAGMRVVRQFDNFEKEIRPGQEISTQGLP